MKVVIINEHMVVDDKLFRTNEEYSYCSSTIKVAGCGCDGQPQRQLEYYQIVVNNKQYDICSLQATLTEKVAPEDRSFNTRQFNKTTQGEVVDKNYDNFRHNGDPVKIWRDSQNSILK